MNSTGDSTERDLCPGAARKFAAEDELHAELQEAKGCFDDDVFYLFLQEQTIVYRYIPTWVRP
jgi:hypothetical protein